MRVIPQDKSGAQRSRREAIEAIVQKLPHDALVMLHEFAEFLGQKYPPDLTGIVEIVDIPRPDKEGVIPAIKRLSKTYPMLDKLVLFDQTSVAMSAHILNEVSSEASIDRLELFFRQEYDKFIEQNASKQTFAF